MSSSSFTQENGSESSKIRLCSKRVHSPVGVSCGCIPSPRSHARLHDSAKRFKGSLPNVPFTSTEEVFSRMQHGSHIEVLQKQGKEQINEDTGHQGSINGATEEEENEEEGSKPFGGSIKNCLKSSPSSDGGQSRTENVSITSSATSPLTGSIRCSDYVKDLNLDGSQCKGCSGPSQKFNEGEFLEQAAKEAEGCGIKCLSTRCPTADTLLNFRCSEGHLFNEPFNPDKKMECPKCVKRLSECAEYAKLHNGKLLNEKYEDTIKFECEYNHIWKVKYSKYLFSKWCSSCSRIQKKEGKKQKQEELQKQKEKFAQDQNEMLEQARREMLKQQPEETFRCEFEVRASQIAMSYLFTNPNEISPQDATMLYFLLLIPAEILTKRMIAMDKTEISSFYRKYAVRIHPDKCKHPEAIQAFQKLAECYKKAMQAL